MESTLPSFCWSCKKKQDKEATVTVLTVLAVLAVLAVSVVTATPLKLNPPFSIILRKLRMAEETKRNRLHRNWQQNWNCRNHFFKHRDRSRKGRDSGKERTHKHRHKQIWWNFPQTGWVANFIYVFPYGNKNT